MVLQKKVGIWMDHSSAQIIDCTHLQSYSIAINSAFTHQVKEAAMHKGEHLMHHKEQHQQAEFYEKLSRIIITYDIVLLFGPTDAKVELFNLLSANHHCEDIIIEVQQTGKMTDNQQLAYVKSYFYQH